jgi:LacI family transcriptional regulator
MAVTMKDIARDLGVSVVTVSKVLRNHSDISAQTRKRVLQRMKDLNYQPNPAARTLVTGRTNLIGLIVPDLVHSFFAEVAKGISARLRAQEYSLIIASSEDDAALERSEIEQMLARRVDALILASTHSGSETVRRIQDLHLPYVLFDRKIAVCLRTLWGLTPLWQGRSRPLTCWRVAAKPLLILAART